jgi:hypothetical protein
MSATALFALVVAVVLVALLLLFWKRRPTQASMPLQVARPLGAPRGSLQEMTVTLELPPRDGLFEFTLETSLPANASFELIPQDLFEVHGTVGNGVLQMDGQSRLVSNGTRAQVDGPALRTPLGRIHYEVQHFPDEDAEDGDRLGGRLGLKWPDRSPVRKDWLQDLSFPRGERQSATTALRNLFSGPSWSRFLRLLDVSAVGAAEDQIRKGYELAIQQTREHVERTEADPQRRVLMVADLEEMQRIARDRIRIKFDEMMSLGDIGTLLEPVDTKPRWEIRSDGTQHSLETVDPPLELESNYRFFRRPKLKFGLGTKRQIPQSVDDVYFKRVGLQIDIFEERATLVAPPLQPLSDDDTPQPEQPPEDSGLVFRRSRLRLELAGKDLLRNDLVSELTVDLNYTFQNRPNESTFLFGFQGKTTPGIDDFELQFRFGFDY